MNAVDKASCSTQSLPRSQSPARPKTKRMDRKRKERFPIPFFSFPPHKCRARFHTILTWQCVLFVHRILADAEAIRTFYTDHYSHQRERDFTCLGSVFKDILGSCLATSYGREEVRRCRGPFEKYFSASAATNTLQVIGRECAVFLKGLPIGKPVDLQERGLANVTLRV